MPPNGISATRATNGAWRFHRPGALIGGEGYFDLKMSPEGDVHGVSGGRVDIDADVMAEIVTRHPAVAVVMRHLADLAVADDGTVYYPATGDKARLDVSDTAARQILALTVQEAHTMSRGTSAVDEITRKWAAELEDIYTRRTAGEHTWTGVLGAFLRDVEAAGAEADA